MSTPEVNVTPEEQQKKDAVAGIDRQIKTIGDWMDAEEYRPETEEQRAAREKRERSKRIIGAVSDGLSALGNLYFTTQYAPNMYDHEKGMGRAADARFERLRAERERKRDRYMNFSLRLGDLENQRASTLRELEVLQERQKQAREKAGREAELQRWKADRAEQEAITARAVAEYAPELQRKKVATEDARTASLRASAGASVARAGYYRSGGSRSDKRHHFRGREYISEKDYAKDVTEAARQYNERHMEEVEVDDGKGGKTRTKQYKPGFKPILTRDREPEEYAGEVESRLAEEEWENTPPGRRNDNDNTPPSRR